MTDHSIPPPPNQSCMNGQDAGYIARMVEERVQKIKEQHQDRSEQPQGFGFDADGWLIYDAAQGDDNNEATSPIRICSRLEVAARIRDQNGENHGRLLRFWDPDDVEHLWPMPMDLLAGDGAAFRQELLSKGLLLEHGPKARGLLSRYVQTAHPERTARCVSRTGWTDQHTAFVLPNDVIGGDGDEPLILQGVSVSSAYRSAGEYDQWLELCKLSEGNSRLIFSLSAAFAPALLFLLGAENCGFQLRGHSSSGKTTCLRVAASVWGGADYIQSWRATANGLESTAVRFNDGILCLDEMAEMDPKEVGKAAYMIANGSGKGRSDRQGGARDRATWRLVLLSSGEISLTAHMAEVAQRARAGQEIRILDLPSDNGRYGCFDDLHGYESGQVFADKLKSLAAENYGHAGPDYLRALLKNKNRALDTVARLRKDLADQLVPVTASGQVRRAFSAFSLIAAAGELAITFGTLCWEEGTALRASQRCFEDWLHARGDCGLQEETAVLQKVRYFLERHGESRFSNWSHDDNHRVTINRAGLRRELDEGGFEYFVFPETFKQEVCQGFDYRQVQQVCIEAGWLLPEKCGNPTRSERLPGFSKRTRVYRFTSQVFDVEDGDDESSTLSD